MQIFSQTLSPLFVSTPKIVSRFWSTLDNTSKNAWKNRADYLTSHGNKRKMVILPDSVPASNVDDFLMECVEEEGGNLCEGMQKVIMNKNTSNTTKNTKLCTPHKVTVGKKIFNKYLGLSAVQRRICFGCRLERIWGVENNSNSPTNDPGFLHLASASRVNAVLCQSNDKLALQYDAEEDLYYQMTSVSNIWNVRG